MVINIRGTGGSGKSTLVRAVMARYQAEPMHALGRTRPIAYKCTRPNGPPLTVIGHYETACGGCDTITSPDEVYNYVRVGAERGDVLFEGIIIQDDVRRLAQLHTEGLPVRVVALDVPLETCLASIQARRDERGDDRPLNPKNTTNRAYRLKGIMARLEKAGVDARWLDREAALTYVLELLHAPTVTNAAAPPLSLFGELV